jgi:hypothetical protein
MAQGEIGDVMMVDAMRPSFSPHQQRLQLSSMDNSSSNNNNKQLQQRPHVSRRSARP